MAKTRLACERITKVGSANTESWRCSGRKCGEASNKNLKFAVSIFVEDINCVPVARLNQICLSKLHNIQLRNMGIANRAQHDGCLQ